MSDHPVIKLPGSELWVAGYEWGLLLAEHWPDGQADDFASAIAHNRWRAELMEPALASGIVDLKCTHVGEYDGADWTWVVRFGNGETWSVTGGCDYTGWDCQSDIECTRLSDHGMTRFGVLFWLVWLACEVGLLSWLGLGIWALFHGVCLFVFALLVVCNRNDPEREWAMKRGQR